MLQNIPRSDHLRIQCALGKALTLRNQNRRKEHILETDPTQTLLKLLAGIPCLCQAIRIICHRLIVERHIALLKRATLLLLTNVLCPLHTQSLRIRRQEAIQAGTFDTKAYPIIIRSQRINKVQITGLTNRQSHGQALFTLLNRREIKLRCIDYPIIRCNQREVQLAVLLIKQHQRLPLVIIIFFQAGIDNPTTLVAHTKLQQFIFNCRLSLLTRHYLRKIAKALTHVLHTHGVG